MQRFTQTHPLLGLALAIFFVAMAYVVAFFLMVFAVLYSLLQVVYFKIRGVLGL